MEHTRLTALVTPESVPANKEGVEGGAVIGAVIGVESYEASWAL